MDLIWFHEEKAMSGHVRRSKIYIRFYQVGIFQSWVALQLTLNFSVLLGQASIHASA